MRAETVFILIVAILIADFILERILSFLNYKSLGQAVPDELYFFKQKTAYEILA